jgi:hypothetical protein
VPSGCCEPVLLIVCLRCGGPRMCIGPAVHVDAVGLWTLAWTLSVRIPCRRTVAWQ